MRGRISGYGTNARDGRKPRATPEDQPPKDIENGRWLSPIRSVMRLPHHCLPTFGPRGAPNDPLF
jgi:hypothetical protein